MWMIYMYVHVFRGRHHQGVDACSRETTHIDVREHNLMQPVSRTYICTSPDSPANAHDKIHSILRVPKD
jgi:hypothetical protein